MVRQDRSSSGNALIDLLPIAQRRHLVHACSTRALQVGERLSRRGRPSPFVCFPLTGFAFISVVGVGHPPLKIGMVGCEGMLGSELLMRRTGAPFTSDVQRAGTALWMTATEFATQLATAPTLRDICTRYLFVLVDQMAQSIVCSCYHDVTQRLARSLLMVQDREQGRDLQLTHALLATMLGVRRSAVTIAAGNLQRQQLISYSRGRIRVVSRAGLRAASCGCYADARRSYAKKLGKGYDQNSLAAAPVH